MVSVSTFADGISKRLVSFVGSTRNCKVITSPCLIATLEKLNVPSVLLTVLEYKLTNG